MVDTLGHNDHFLYTSLEAGYSSGSEEDPREGRAMERKKNPIKPEMVDENSHSFDLIQAGAEIQASNFFPVFKSPAKTPAR